jgi:hypothetical protein
VSYTKEYVDRTTQKREREEGRDIENTLTNSQSLKDNSLGV